MVDKYKKAIIFIMSIVFTILILVSIFLDKVNLYEVNFLDFFNLYMLTFLVVFNIAKFCFEK